MSAKEPLPVIDAKHCCAGQCKKCACRHHGGPEPNAQRHCRSCAANSCCARSDTPCSAGFAMVSFDSAAALACSIDAPLAHPPRTSKAYFWATVLPSRWDNAFGAIVETLVQLCMNRCTHVMPAQVERLMMTSYKQLSLQDWVYPGAMLTLLVVQLFMFSSSLHHAWSLFIMVYPALSFLFRWMAALVQPTVGMHMRQWLDKWTISLWTHLSACQASLYSIRLSW